MNVQYTARQPSLTPEIKAYCEKRLARLKDLVDEILDVNVILTSPKEPPQGRDQRPGQGRRTCRRRGDPGHHGLPEPGLRYLEKRVRKERAKWREKKRRGGRERKILAPAVEAPEREMRVVRANFYSLKPMSLEEAIVQLDVKNKEVFLFRREGSQQWSAVFRRKGGHYGLVEPE